MNVIEKLRMLHRAWRYRLQAERQEIAFVRKNLAPGQTAVDIGAHKGAFTYWMQKAVGRTGRVFSFEPQPELAEYLNRVVAAFRLSNVTVTNAALSSEPGKMCLFRPADVPSPGATLESGLHDGDAATVSTTVDTLDRYFSRHAGRPIHLIKCDVEGHELEVFRGAENILTQDRPTLVFECVADHHTQGPIDEVFDHLHDLGYAGFFFEHGEMRDVRDFRPEVHQRLRTRSCIENFVFVHGAAKAATRPEQSAA